MTWPLPTQMSGELIWQLYLSIYLSINLSIIYLSSIYLSIYLSISLSLSLSIYLSIHPSIYLSNLDAKSKSASVDFFLLIIGFIFYESLDEHVRAHWTWLRWWGGVSVPSEAGSRTWRVTCPEEQVTDMASESLQCVLLKVKLTATTEKFFCFFSFW